MTDFKVEYRGVEVPSEVLTGLIGAATLAAFKKGVDAAFALSRPEVQTESESSEYDYYSDHDVTEDEWVWRFPKGSESGELNKAYDPGWITAYATRQDVERDSDVTRIDTLPVWAQD